LITDNAVIGRRVALTSRAAATFGRQYGPLIPLHLDPAAPVRTLTALASDLPRGTPYVLCVLKPTRDFRLDADDLAHPVSMLTANQLTSLPSGDYLALGGVAGEQPVLVAAADRPFRRTVDIAGTSVQIRMDSWLAADTIRRMGFGHVIVNRQHTLIVERGVSF